MASRKLDLQNWTLVSYLVLIETMKTSSTKFRSLIMNHTIFLYIIRWMSECWHPNRFKIHCHAKVEEFSIGGWLACQGYLRNMKNSQVVKNMERMEFAYLKLKYEESK